MARLTLLAALLCSISLPNVLATWGHHGGWGNHHRGYYPQQQPRPVFNCPPQHCPQQHCPQHQCPPPPQCPAPPAPRPCPPPPYHPPCPVHYCPPPPYRPPCPVITCPVVPPPPTCPAPVTCPTVPPTTPVTCAPEVKANCTEETTVKTRRFQSRVQSCFTGEWQAQVQKFTPQDLAFLERLRSTHKIFDNKVLISSLTTLQSQQNKLTLENWSLELELEEGNATQHECRREELHAETNRLREIEDHLKKQKVALATRYNSLVQQKKQQCQTFLKDESESEEDAPPQQQTKGGVKKQEQQIVQTNQEQEVVEGGQEVVDVDQHSQENEIEWGQGTDQPPRVFPGTESRESTEGGGGFDCSLTIAVLQKNLLKYKNEIEINKYKKELLISCISMAIESESQQKERSNVSTDIYSIYTSELLVEKLSLLSIQYKKTVAVNRKLHAKLSTVAAAAHVVCNDHAAQSAVARLTFDNFILREQLLILNANVQAIIKEIKECSEKSSNGNIATSSLFKASELKSYDESAKDTQDIGGRKYFVNKVEKLTWRKASEACTKRGMHLISLETPEEDKLVSAAVTDASWRKYWTDAVQLAVDSPVLVWDSTRSPLGHAPWSDVTHNETASGPQCGVLGRWDSDQVAWHLTDCQSQRFYICEQQ